LRCPEVNLLTHLLGCAFCGFKPQTFGVEVWLNGNEVTLEQFTLEMCMGVGNPMGIPFPWEWK